MKDPPASACEIRLNIICVDTDGLQRQLISGAMAGAAYGKPILEIHFLDPRSSILDPRSSILDPRSSILHHRLSYLPGMVYMKVRVLAVRGQKPAIPSLKF